MATERGNTTAQLQLLKKGGPFKIERVLKPALADDQVLIRQKVISINSLDCKQRDYGLLIEKWPHVLGIEGAGVIEAVGAKVQGLRVGDEVTAWMAGVAHGEKWGGSYQEHVVMPSRFVARKPQNMSIEEAASLPICYITAISAIHDGLRIPLPYLPGTPTEGRIPSSILILGGSAATGAAAIQLLRLAYPNLPILVTSSAKHHAHLTALGATALIDYHSTSIVSDIKAASPAGKGVDMIVDCVGAGSTQTDICDVLDPNGSRLYSAVLAGPPVPVPSDVKRLDISGWVLTTMQGGAEIMPALTKLVEEGKYRLPLPVTVVGHGLETVPEVMGQVMSVSGAKLVVSL